MIRDNYSKALLETNTTDLQKYRREKFRERELDAMKKDIASIKRSIKNINQTLENLDIK